MMLHQDLFLSDNPRALAQVWSPDHRSRLATIIPIAPLSLDRTQLPAHTPLLANVDAIFSTWGMPELPERELTFFPKLKIVFYAGGSIRPFATPLLNRGIRVVNAAVANAIPVAEFALSQILFSLKLGWQHVNALRQNPTPAAWCRLQLPGVYQAKVGIVSMGLIGQKLCELLTPFQVEKLAYDPFLAPEVFAETGSIPSDLPTLFAQADVVSLHTPLLPTTTRLITGELIASMKPSATLINTSRGAIIREDEMIAVLQSRPDLTAVLDVTHPQPPTPDSPLYDLPNVVMTPHIAGSLGREVGRMADLMIEECQAWQEGRPLRYATSEALPAHVA